MVVWGILFIVSIVCLVIGLFLFKPLFITNPDPDEISFVRWTRLVFVASIAITMSPLFFEAVVLDRYMFKSDGTLIETISAPRFMLQSTYNAKVSQNDAIVFKKYSLHSGNQHSVSIPIGESGTMRMDYWVTLDSENKEVELFGALLRARIDRSNLDHSYESLFSRYFQVRATNEIAAIQKKALELMTNGWGYTNHALIKADLECFALRELTPLFLECETYPVSVSTTLQQ